MNIRDLEYFQELSRLNSFTGVANSFEVSQPTITYAVRRLEEHYHCELFVKDPSHRSVVLTQEGEILAKHIDAILQELHISEKELARASHHQIKMGFPPIIRARILSALLKKGLDISFLSDFQMLGAGSLDLLDQLIEGELDFSLIGSLHPLEHPKLVTKELYQRRFYIMVSEKHPLAQRPSVGFDELLDEKFILLDEGHIHLEAFNQLNDAYDNQAKVLLKLSEVSMIGQMVRENLGITFMTDFVLFSDIDGIVKIPLTDDPHRFHVSYAYPKNTVPSPAVTQLIDQLENLGID